MYRKTKSYFRGKYSKYSNETIAFNTQVTEDLDGNVSFPVNTDPDSGALLSRGILIVPATNILGNRKVKNFTLKLTANGNDDQIFGALVYVPEGTMTSPLQVGGASQSMYEPNQNVICTFIIPPNAFRDSDSSITQQSAPTQIVVSNRLARNLNTGDCVALVFAAPNGLAATNEEPVVISGTCNFAIKY